MDEVEISETNELSSDSEKIDEHWSTIDAGTSNLNSKPDNTENQEHNNDIPNLSEISLTSADTYTPKSVYCLKYSMPVELTNWEPHFIDDKLVISGVVAGSVQAERVCEQRVSSLIFKDDFGGTCCILGPMKTDNEVPELIRNQFKYPHKMEPNGEKSYKDGLPENWRKLRQLWKFYMDTVHKDLFDWILHFTTLGIEPLPSNGRNNSNSSKILNNGPKSRIKKKYEKYKSMLEQEILRDTLNADSEEESASDVACVRRKATSKLNEQTSLNKRTSCYINNQIPFEDLPTPIPTPTATLKTIHCQTDLTSNDFEVNRFFLDNDEKATNVTILSPIKYNKLVPGKCAIPAKNDRLNKLRKEESNKMVMKNSFFDSNEDSSTSEFYQNICANSTMAQPTQKDTCKKIHYICSKTLEKLEHRAQSDTQSVDDQLDIDIDVFSQTVLKSPDNSKQLKTQRNLSDKSDCRKSPTAKGVKRKKDEELSPVRCSLRKRKKINYRELLFNPIRITDASLIIDADLRKTKPKPKSQPDEKLTKTCYVVLVRENLESKINKKKADVEKENIVVSTSSSPADHVFKTPLVTKVLKRNKSFHVPNYMPKIPRKKLSLPANPMEMWNIIKCNNINNINSRMRCDTRPPSLSFSILSEASSDSSDKRRRKLFSPDNWMQSDGCLKTLSQNQYQSSSDSRCSIRFTPDPSIDSELSDSSCFTSSFK